MTAGFWHVLTAALSLQPRQYPGEEPTERLALAMPEFFRTMRIPVLAGREFTARDNKHSPVPRPHQRRLGPASAC